VEAGGSSDLERKHYSSIFDARRRTPRLVNDVAGERACLEKKCARFMHVTTVPMVQKERKNRGSTSDQIMKKRPRGRLDDGRGRS